MDWFRNFKEFIKREWFLFMMLAVLSLVILLFQMF